MKTVKDGETRRREILVTARTLFVQKGYDHTSINDILKIVDIAKGTFYYYFSSKEEILESIIVDIVEEGICRARQILANTQLTVYERIMGAIMVQRPDFEGAQEIQEVMHKVQNARFQDLYQRQLMKRLPPLLAEVVEEGNQTGIMSVEHPLECMEAVLLLGHMLFDCNICEWKEDELPGKALAFLEIVENMCGVNRGELRGFLQMFEEK